MASSMLDHPSCLSTSFFYADTSVHKCERNTWGPNGVDEVDILDEGRHDLVEIGESEVEMLL